MKLSLRGCAGVTREDLSGTRGPETLQDVDLGGTTVQRGEVVEVRAALRLMHALPLHAKHFAGASTAVESAE